MKNIYHSDIYQFNTPVSSYWEDHSSENLNLDKLNKDISSEIVVIGGGYTGLSCAQDRPVYPPPITTISELISLLSLSRFKFSLE